jgi:hypothetical protein
MDELIKKDLTKKEAEALAERLNDYNKEWGRYFYHAQQSKEDDSIEIRPGRIEMPRLGFIDPGRPKTDAEKVPSLAGKTGKGKIGKDTVTFQFRGKDNSGTVTINGDVTAEGKWEETGTGAVYIKIPNVVLRGGTDGKKAAGLRFSEEKSQPLTDWSVIFDTSTIPPDESAPKGLKALLGKWIADTGNGGSQVLELNETRSGKYTSTVSFRAITSRRRSAASTSGTGRAATPASAAWPCASFCCRKHLWLRQAQRTAAHPIWFLPISGAARATTRYGMT